jgi:YqjK-like protein
MSERTRELAEREAELKLRCAAQRRAFGRDVRGLETRLQSVDRAASIARSTLLHPVVIVGGVAGLLMLGRARVFHLIGRGLVLAAAARRVLRIVKPVMATRERGRTAV